MHIKQLCSDDLYHSPTYSLLCSVSISVQRLRVRQPFWMQTPPSNPSPIAVASWEPDPHLWWCNADNAGVTPAAFDRLWDPLSCHGGHSSTQHSHAALWPPLSSWTSSENNLLSASKKREKKLTMICITCAVCSSSHYWYHTVGIRQQKHKQVITEYVWHYGLFWQRSCFILLCTLLLWLFVMLCACVIISGVIDF